MDMELILHGSLVHVYCCTVQPSIQQGYLVLAAELATLQVLV
jgi:hypothetical protein